MGCNSSKDAVVRSASEMAFRESIDPSLDPKKNMMNMLEGGCDFGETPSRAHVSVPTALIMTVPRDTTKDPESQDLVIANLNLVPVYFKVKVTHPALLTCQPNGGRIWPSESATVVVRLKGRKAFADLPANVKGLIQTLKVVTHGRDDKLPPSAWSMAPKEIVGSHRVKIEFTQMDDDEVNLSKFTSAEVQLPWWKQNN